MEKEWDLTDSERALVVDSDQAGLIDSKTTGLLGFLHTTISMD